MAHRPDAPLVGAAAASSARRPRAPRGPARRRLRRRSGGDATTEAAIGDDGGDGNYRSGAESADPTTTASDEQAIEGAALGEYDSLDDLAAAVRGDRAPSYSLDCPTT